ncbi:DUF192 domain-containing protein [Ideonella sp.]|uniref:DUF192 domain-containing protein n=1 Tax=Ideonella sp. TaxID=1929293 RepID=UPI002B474B68|nr:DUF192 domain-containing protein [Ideonella sp.]HJV70212.1 DUF192 domain-containing protein [Ideonella sp.]
MTLIKTRRVPAALLAGLAALALSHSAPAAPDGQPQQLPTVTLHAGMHNIVAQVAKTGEQRQTGLMYRQQMAGHEGMIFVFESPATQCFWMRNTLIPLSAAFVADDGSIVNIEDMKPLSDESHCSRQPVRFVLEMNQGWFAKRGLKTGSRLTGPLFN